MPKYNIVWFDQIDKEDVSLVGRKGVNLGEMIKAGFLVPEGFVVTSEAFDKFLVENNLEMKAKHLISTVNINHPDSLNQATGFIKKYFMEGNLSSDFKLELYSAYKKLGGLLKDIHVRIIPSPHDFSPANKIIDNVKGETNLFNSIKELWASNFTEMNIIRNHSAPSFTKSLIVQRNVESDKSGKILTIDTERNNRNLIIIKAVHGVLDNVVNLMTLPDYYIIKKDTLEIISKEIRHQSKMTKRIGAEKKVIDVKEAKKSQQKLMDSEINELAKIAKAVERLKYFPQEIEWVIERGKIYLVRTSPITI